MQYMKLSTSRDFRINAETLEAALQEQDNNSEVKQSHNQLLFLLSKQSEMFFFHVVGEITESVFTGRSTGSRGDTGAQTEEEKTLIVRNHLQMILIILYPSSGQLQLVPQSYFTLSRDPPVMSMIW